MAARIVVTRRLPAALLQPLLLRPATRVAVHESEEPPSPAALRALLAADGGTDAIVCTLSDTVDAAALDAAGPRLRAVSTLSVGFSHIDVAAATARGVRVGYTPDILTEATADLVLGLTLATCRRIVEAAGAVKAGQWGSWSPFWMCGSDLHHKRVGLVGLGRIGTAIAQRLRGFGCSLAYTGRSGPKPDVEAQLGGGAHFLPLGDLLRWSDVVILICALTPETRGLIGAAELASMREDAVLINAARGEVVDQAALIEALKSRPRFRAGVDVTTPEPLPAGHALLALPNALVLPHIGSASEVCRSQMVELTVANALAALDGAERLPAEVPASASAHAARLAAAAGGGAGSAAAAAKPE